MNIIKKAALGLAMLAGATALTSTAADARVTVGFGVGGYGYYDRVCDPYSRWYDPYRCDSYDDYDYYSGPVFIDGLWLNGGYRSRWYGGHRQFYYNNSWHGGSGWNHGGFSHGGGHWNGNGGGHWNGNGGGHWNNGGGHHGGGHHH